MGTDYRAKLQEIKWRMMKGLLTYDEAEKVAEPVLREMNAKGEKIAKRFGKRHTPLTFRYCIR